MTRRIVGWVVAGVIVIILILVLLALVLAIKPKQRDVQVHQINPTAMDNPLDAGTVLQPKPAPGFTLTDQFGKTVSLSQFRGKVVVLAFVDSDCTNICPLTTQSMMDAVRMLGPAAAADVQLLGVNANPTATSVSDVKQYSVDHQMMNAWHFLTGSPGQLKSVWKNYDILAQIVGGQIDHTPALYIIDPQGQERVLYMTPSQYGAVAPEASVIARQIAQFLPSGVKTDIQSVQYHAPASGPTQTIQIPQVTSAGVNGQVSIGPGRPQLLVFFASWAPDAKATLAALNAYATTSGHPQVIAVDVAPTEPSGQVVESMLSGLPSLAYHVGIDRTGDVADAYQVTDLMWFALTDGKGHIVWHHDGALSTTSLSAAVAHALHSAH